MIDFLKRWTSSEHERTREDLSAYIDGQLSVASKSRLEKHLRTCSACREELASLQKTVDLLHTLPTAKLPRSFLLPATQAVAQRQAQRMRLRYSYLQMATAAATAVLILVVSGEALLRYLPVQSPEATSATEAAAESPAPHAEPGFGVLPAAPDRSAESSAAATQTPLLAQEVQSFEGVPESSPQPLAAPPLRAGTPSPASVVQAPGATFSTQTPPIAKSGIGGGPAADAGTATAQAEQTASTVGSRVDATPTPGEPARVPMSPHAQATSAPENVPAASSTPFQVAVIASRQPGEGGSTPPSRGEPAPTSSTWLSPLLLLRPYLPGIERALIVLIAALVGAMLWLRTRAG